MNESLLKGTGIALYLNRRRDPVAYLLGGGKLQGEKGFFI